MNLRSAIHTSVIFKAGLEDRTFHRERLDDYQSREDAEGKYSATGHRQGNWKVVERRYYLVIPVTKKDQCQYLRARSPVKYSLPRSVRGDQQMR